MHLPDINFWLALVFQSHHHHGAAKQWMRGATRQSCCLCRVTQLGFLRLATNRKVFPVDALPMNEAWRAYDQLLTDDRVVFAEEPDDIETAWRSFTQSRSYSTNLWTDAYLAAFAQTADFEIVTFDQGFIQFTTARVTLLN
jgi:uncharacterized protein